MPFFYLFWISASPHNERGSGSVCALVLGSISAITLFFLGDFIDQPGGFAYPRWLNACVDVVTLPALIPFVVFILIIPLRVSRDVTGFALLWLIPHLAIKTALWTAHRDPSLLIAVPLLQTGVVMGISGCLRLIICKKVPAIICGVVLLPVFPLAAATAYWYFFCQQPIPALVMLVLITVVWGVIHLLARRD
jgi:hypothetical protein